MLVSRHVIVNNAYSDGYNNVNNDNNDNNDYNDNNNANDKSAHHDD